MKIKKVIAIIPPTKGTSFTGESIPPLGIVRILNYVKKSFPEIEVELWDGTLMSLPIIIERIKTLEKGTLVAISAHTSYNYANCLAILEQIPIDVEVVLGGIHLYESRLGKMATEKHNFHVIQGQGEFALPQYIEYLEGKRKISEVNNLMYLENGIFTKNKVRYFSQEELSFPEYEGILNLEEYGRHYRKIFGESDLAFVVMSPEGCLWKNKSGGCLFCDIGSVCKIHSPLFLPRWIAHHLERYGTNKRLTFWNYADEASGAGFAWWEEVAKNMKKLGLKPQKEFSLKVYVKSGQGFFDNDKVASALARCGTEIIHLGIEGGDNKILSSWHKGCTIADHIKSVAIAKKYHFKMIISFAIGAPGTTMQSIINMRNLMTFIKERGNILAIAALPVAPMPGSLMWKMLKKKVKEKNPEKYTELFMVDNPNLEEIRQLWFNEMCPDFVKEFGSLPKAMQWLHDEAISMCKLSSTGIISRIE